MVSHAIAGGRLRLPKHLNFWERLCDKEINSFNCFHLLTVPCMILDSLVHNIRFVISRKSKLLRHGAAVPLLV